MNWLKEVAEASAAVAVLAIVNEYLDASTEGFRSKIPPGLMPAFVPSQKDLQEWHGKLTLAVTENTAKAPPELLDLSYLFIRASARIAELERHAPANGAIHDRALEG